jgi:hypothetical protein
LPVNFTFWTVSLEPRVPETSPTPLHAPCRAHPLRRSR